MSMRDLAVPGGEGRAATPSAIDLLLAAVMLAASELELWLVAHTHGHSRPVTAVALFTMSVAVAIRRAFPLVAVIVCMLALVVQEALRGAVTRDLTIALLFPAVVMYSAGAHLHGRRAIAALAIAVALIVCDALVGNSFSGLTFSLMLVSLPWAFGQLLGDRSRRAAAFQRLAEELEQQRAARARAAVDRERARITGELHDVIAHDVGVMTLQVAGSRAVLARDPDRAKVMVLAVEETGREALAVIRRVLGILRAYEDPRELAPQPGIDQLEQLIAESRRHGLAASLRIEGEPGDVTAGVDLAVYRIVEASLELLRDEATPSAAVVSLNWHPTRLELRITPAPPLGSPPHDALAAIRERVALYDGELAVSDRADGTSLLRAALPLQTVAV
jgi:signal transduction histidine kinase